MSAHTEEPLPHRKQGAARQRWRDDSPEPLFRTIMSRTADKHDRQKIHDEFFAIITEDCDELSKRIWVMLEYWFDNHYTTFMRGLAKSEPTAEERAAEQAEQARTVAANRKIIRAKINQKANEKAVLLLGTMMPIGKLFGDCTGSELRAMRTHLPKAMDIVIRKVGSDQVVRNVLTDRALAKMNLRLV